MRNNNYIVKKSRIAYCLFTVALLYIISPWFFEKYLLFNELLALAGLVTLIYKRGRVGRDPISLLVTLLLFWGLIHAIVSLFRMDSIYYYLRNSVIIYSMLTFFLGFYGLKYLGGYISGIRKFLKVYIGVFLFIRQSKYIFERFGVSMLFPALFKNPANRWVPYLLVLMNFIYGITYGSLTALTIGAFYFLIFVSPGYKFFCQTFFLMVASFAVLFIYLVPYLSIISRHYNHYNEAGISDVVRSNWILAINNDNTWRMILWKQIIVDDFPGNIFGLGFGTSAIKYFPIEDIHKLATLPYVVGAHNAFIYLFGRLGIVFLLLIIPIYLCLFKEYYYFKSYYYANRQILLFWSFIPITIICAFNPSLESPIFAGAFWLLLGFTARCIHDRRILNRTTLADP